jgi:hypothetical protein
MSVWKESVGMEGERALEYIVVRCMKGESYGQHYPLPFTKMKPHIHLPNLRLDRSE